MQYKTVDEYMATVPDHALEAIEQMRQAIREVAPNATEVISYGMPAFKQNKVLVYYAPGKEHIGFYPTPGPIAYFRDELKGYKTSKGAIQFPLDKKIPKTLVKKIVKYRLEEDRG